MQSPMNKDEVHLKQLAQWISDRWQSGFSHSYSISNSKSLAWSKWRKEIQPNSPEVWWCHSFEEAGNHYSWIETDVSFADLSMSLQAALKNNDNQTCAKLCQKIFKWGGVARRQNDRSNIWVMSHLANGDLCTKIKEATKLLQPDSRHSLEEFNGNNLLMNSALTKVYAAADLQKNVVIYDGRVGAALGLIVRRMLEQQNLTQIPTSLRFRWGPPSTKKAARLNTRDPSTESLIFKRLPNTSQSKTADLRRAKLSKITNKLCRYVTNLLANDGTLVGSSELEKALFMIGYDVRDTFEINSELPSQDN